MMSLYTDLEVRVRDFGRKVAAREDGAGMVEYALLVALIGIVLVVAIGFLTGAIGNLFSEAGTTL